MYNLFQRLYNKHEVSQYQQVNSLQEDVYKYHVHIAIKDKEYLTNN